MDRRDFVSFIVRSIRSLRPLPLLSSSQRSFKGNTLVNWIMKNIPQLKGNQKYAIYYCEFLYQRYSTFTPTSPISFFILEETYRLTGKKRVVIIGGGFAGSQLSKSLLIENNYEVVLISESDSFECILSFPFIISKPSSYVNLLHSPYSKFLSKAKIVKGKVISMNSRLVYLSDHSFFSYDYCVIATGSYYEMPFTGEGVFNPIKSEDMVKATEQLNKSRSAVVIGMGSVGVEVAGEIAGKFPNVKLTLVSSSSLLLERIPNAHVIALNFFKSLPNVQFVFNDKVSSYDRSSFSLSTVNGLLLKGEVVIPCVGFKPNTSFMKEEMEESLDEKGYVKVTPSLQLINLPHIFAVGDILPCDEEKLAQNAQIHVEIVAKNIKALDEGKPLFNYDPTPKIMLISMGPKRGFVASKDGVITEGFAARFFKNAVEKKVMAQFS